MIKRFTLTNNDANEAGTMNLHTSAPKDCDVFALIGWDHFASGGYASGGPNGNERAFHCKDEEYRSDLIDVNIDLMSDRSDDFYLIQKEWFGTISPDGGDEPVLVSVHWHMLFTDGVSGGTGGQYIVTLEPRRVHGRRFKTVITSKSKTPRARKVALKVFTEWINGLDSLQNPNQ